jgi:hypothetical protein
MSLLAILTKIITVKAFPVRNVFNIGLALKKVTYVRGDHIGNK